MVHFCMNVTREIEEIVIGLFVDKTTPLQGPHLAELTASRIFSNLLVR